MDTRTLLLDVSRCLLSTMKIIDNDNIPFILETRNRYVVCLDDISLTFEDQLICKARSLRYLKEHKHLLKEFYFFRMTDL